MLKYVFMNEITYSIANTYQQVLDKLGIPFKESRFYFHVGEPECGQGWIIHISVLPMEMGDLLYTVLPILDFFKTPYKLAKSNLVHSELNSGRLGFGKIGKIITIYPRSDEKRVELVKLLINKTNDFNGPRVVTDFKLGKIVYCRYGSFANEIVTDSHGNAHRIIYNDKGGQIHDMYYTPPIIPAWDKIPFALNDEQEHRRFHFINGRYFPYKALKVDLKGNVVMCAYLHKYIFPRFCVIKQGRSNMHHDVMGRNMVNILVWQCELSKSLGDIISMPKVLDFFDDNGQVCLVLEYISGLSLALSSYAISQGLIWYKLDLQKKLEILDYLIQVIDNIQRMHELEYVHRDITGQNFIVDSKKKVYLIDVELAYSVKLRIPNPPFSGGTPGFVSPQQEKRHDPMYSDDVFSIGALLLQILGGGLEPCMTIESNIDNLCQKIFFFLRSEKMTNLILACISADPEVRPSVDAIREEVVRYKSEQLIDPIITYKQRFISNGEIDTCIRKVIHFLGKEDMTSNGLWYSSIKNDYDWEIYPLGDKHVFSAIHRGVAGPLFVLATAKILGYDISSCDNNSLTAWRFISKNVLSKIEDVVTGLHYGSSGVALTIAKSVHNGLLPDDSFYRESILRCLDRESHHLDVISGIAGDGLTILQCASLMIKEDATRLLDRIVYSILHLQEVDGSWRKVLSDNQYEKVNGFGYGIAGMVYFLLEYGTRYDNPTAILSAKKGLQYLVSKMNKEQGYYDWTDSDRAKNRGWWWCQGGPGIALTFLKAYEYFKEDSFLHIAEMALRRHPKEIIFQNLGQCHGVVGLGEIYLEAYRVTANTEWLERANWIACLVLALKFEPNNEDVFWLTENVRFPTADLMLGNGGILHFLIRFRHPDKVFFPLLPEPIK